MLLAHQLLPIPWVLRSKSLMILGRLLPYPVSPALHLECADGLEGGMRLPLWLLTCWGGSVVTSTELNRGEMALVRELRHARALQSIRCSGNGDPYLAHTRNVVL